MSYPGNFVRKRKKLRERNIQKYGKLTCEYCAVLLATGQDYRAMNAAIHGYASKTGSYQSLSFIEQDSEHLIFKVRLPYSLGVVGGITNVHPTVKTNLKIIKENCDVETLAQVMAATGLAQRNIMK